MAADADAPALPPPDFLQQRLAAVAAVPVEQRSHDEAGFLRAHQLLAAAQESLAARRPGSPAAEADAAEPDVHFALATLSLLGGLEELCSIGVSLQWALNLHSRVLYGLARHARALQRSADEMLGYSIVSALVQFHYETDLLRDDTPPEADERPEPATWPNPELLLEQLTPSSTMTSSARPTNSPFQSCSPLLPAHSQGRSCSASLRCSAGNGQHSWRAAWHALPGWLATPAPHVTRRASCSCGRRPPCASCAPATR